MYNLRKLIERNFQISNPLYKSEHWLDDVSPNAHNSIDRKCAQMYNEKILFFLFQKAGF